MIGHGPFPRRTLAEIFGAPEGDPIRGLAGGTPTAGQADHSRRSSGDNASPCRRLSSGIIRMITLEVSRWIRSCSMPIRITQPGEFQAIGTSRGMVARNSSTNSRTRSR